MSAAEQPTLRASHSLATLRSVEVVAPGTTGAVLARLPREARDGLAAATSVDWIPAAWDLALVRALEATLGRPATRRVARVTMADNLGGPLLGNLVRGAIQLFGATPEGLYRWSGRAYAHVCRGCGELSLAEAAGPRATLRVASMPGELAVPEYLEAMAGTIEAVIDVCTMDGEVTMEPRPGGALFHAGWRRRRG